MTSQAYPIGYIESLQGQAADRGEETDMAQEREIRTSSVSIVAAACACMSWLLAVANGAMAEKLRVGVNLTTIETLPIYLVESEPAGAGIELSGGAIPALTAGSVDIVTNAETQAILRSTANALGPDAVILQGPDYRERFNLNTTATILADPTKRAAVTDLLRAIIRTSLRVREHAQEVQPVIAAKLGLPQEIVAATWGLFRFPASIPDDLLASMVEHEPWMAKNQNRAPRLREAIAALIDPSVWREAQGEPAAKPNSPHR